MEHESTDDEHLFEDNVDKDVYHGTQFEESMLSDQEKKGPDDPIFNPATIFDPTFQLRMIFSGKKEFQKAVTSHAIRSRTIKFSKNDKERIYATCPAKDCGWRINLRIMEDGCSWQVTEYRPKHTCATKSKVKNMKSKWLADKYLHKFKTDPKRNVKAWRMDVIKNLNSHVSTHQAYRAKRLALNHIQGTSNKQFSKLWEYGEELRRSNPGSTIILGTKLDEASNSRFSTMYLCFKGLKDGFLSGCRPIIGVDDCHLEILFFDIKVILHIKSLFFSSKTRNLQN
ncbi:unnamed protein product [Cuscuta europaea]|uniref:Transposase MuDR plant domain-containing protein n=1 Tax=Cuscuta europaea TaxID=41803 RepID=A0A9P0Z9Y2_CUSEU|nr:unnamed protein product [Cuscuta europaea]